MNFARVDRKRLALSLGIVALGFTSQRLSAQTTFAQINLVSDIPGLAANTDPRLVNPWGISFAPTGPFWVSDADTGVATIYNSSGTPLSLVVTIPGPGGPAPGVPTGQVYNIFNGSGAFNGDLFIFASATGTIAGWRGALGTTAETLLNKAGTGASYLGVALGSVAGNAYVYAANFGNNRIDVIPNTGAPALTGTFTDPGLPGGYAPFNIQNISNTLFVTYALHATPVDEADGPGLGLVDRYDLQGNFLGRFVTNGGVLNAPWGLALAPSGFGSFGGNLLIGNLGDGTINAFDFGTGAFKGTLMTGLGTPLVNDGLWGLTFGNGAQGGSPTTLYFAAGIDDENHGLFGAIIAVPESGSMGLTAGIVLLGLCATSRVFRRKKLLSPAL